MNSIAELRAEASRAQSAFNAARNERERHCAHRRAFMMQHTYGVEVTCPDCEQVWSLQFGGIHCADDGPSMQSRWTEFLDHFVNAPWAKGNKSQLDSK